MTICISAKITKKDGTVITRSCSDSEVSYGNQRLLGLADSEKVIQFPGASIAASGSGCVFETLLKMKADQKYIKAVQFKTRDDIVEFSLDFFELFDNLVQSSNVSKEDASMGTILITTEDKIYAIFADLSIFEFKNYFCSGSGASTAQGLMLAYYETLDENSTEEDLEKLLTKVIEKTCEIELGCGGDIKIYTVEAPNPPLTKKTKKKKLTNESTNGKISSCEDSPEVKNDNKERTRRAGF